MDWDEQKNKKLRDERGVSFEDVQALIEDNKVLADLTHHNSLRYPNQRMFIIEIRNYAYLVPYVEDNEKIFLKTIIPSRKATKEYLNGGHES